MKIQKAIVTGGSGFIGSHLVDALVKAGVKVTVIDKKKTRKAYRHEEVKYRLFDIQSPEAAEVIRKAKADVVFHLAAHIHDRESVAEPIMNAQNNIMGTLNILEAIRAVGKGRVVFASTSAIVGEAEEFPVAESKSLLPVSPYAISKFTAERYLHFYHRVLSVPYAALRFANVYGPRQDSSAESGAVGVFASRLLRGESALVNNDGLTTRDYVYVGDVVRALLLAAEANVCDVFHIGTGLETSTLELFHAVREEVGVQADPDFREEVKDIVKRSALDSAKAKSVLGWEPEVSLEEGIEKTVAWYRDNI